MVLMESALYAKVKKGTPAPRFSLPGIDGRMHSLTDFKDKKAVLVVFMCNHCPYVKHKIGAIVSLFNEFKNKNVSVIGINSNDPSRYPEDSFEGMKQFAKEKNIEFPYLIDEAQDVARSYGASCTPDPFLLDGNLNLVYHGRFDDALEPGTIPKTHEMKDAILQLLKNQKVTVDERPSIGCSIKWKN